MRHLLILIVPVILFSGCKDAQPSSVVTLKRPVKAVRVMNQTLSIEKHYPAVIVPPELNSLSFETNGVLQELKLEIGQTLEQGQVIARLQDEEFVIRRNEAKAALSLAQAEYELAVKSLNRSRAVANRGLVTASELDQKISERDIAHARLEQSKLQLRLAQKELNNTQLVSPFDSVINTIDSTSFSTVTPQTKILSLYKSDKFEAKILVGSDLLPSIKKGMEAKISFVSYPGKVLTAHITEIGKSAHSLSSFPVFMAIQKPPKITLMPGMAVDVSIEIPLSSTSGFKLPISAICTDCSKLAGKYQPQDEQLFVYVVDEQTYKVERRLVKAVETKGNSVLIEQGLKQGELVVTAGVAFLLEGQEVTLLSDSPEGL